MPSGEERESVSFDEALLPDAVMTHHCEADAIRAEMWQAYPLQVH
jgi:hypothetical protein